MVQHLLKLRKKQKPASHPPLLHKPRRERLAVYALPEPIFNGPGAVLFSDLHLYGKQNRASTVFPENVAYLFTLLKKYHARGFALYGLGDVLEGWRYRTKHILAAHPDFVKFLTDNVEIVRGNHDWDTWLHLKKEFGKDSHEFLRVGPVFMSHGHEADPMNRKHAWYSKYATKFAGVLKQLGLNTEPVFRRLRSGQKDRIKKTYQKHVLKLRNTIAPTATYFFFGHMHMPYIDTTLPGCVITNLGSIANSVRIFSYVEVTPTEIILWKVTL